MIEDPFERFWRVWFEEFWKPELPKRILTKRPLVDLIDRGDSYVVVIELPGVRKEDIDLRITEDSLVVRAEVKRTEEEKAVNYIRREIRAESFYRTITFPEPVRPETAKARYRNGILEVEVKKKKERGVRIRIE